ncbi:hypothetical protein PUN28_017905 [Cardiocondyla obscurior]|uniref:Reverse transcriptase domain-containing protein n=1 Tax=Cardiocondyla obscurior TaxID=286306 RepID=A0AAW2EM55_9HYME
MSTETFAQKNKETVYQELTLYLQEIFPTKKLKHRKPDIGAKILSRKQARRAEYAKVQDLWQKNRNKCIRTLLDDISEVKTPSKEVMVPFWQTVMTSGEDVTPGCATRMSNLLKFDQRQRAFRPTDGCSDNVFLLDLLLRFHSKNHKPLYTASIDIAKAFDSPMIAYITNAYARSSTKLGCSQWTSESIQPTCGVKQGDPMSPVIFNMIIERLLIKLPNDIGARIDGIKVNAAAFADDMLLFSSTPTGLQKSDDWKYLGIPFTPEGRAKTNASGKLRDALEKLTKAPLKPQQRLFALRTNVIPGLYHQLELGNVTLSKLRKCDNMIRQAVRTWINLPTDTPNAYIHASIGDGGLGISSLRWTVPLRRLNRLKKLPLAEQPANSAPGAFTQNEIKQCENRLKDNQQNIKTSADIYKRWAEQLYTKVDGIGLKESLCRAGCNRPETLNHVLQQCHRTHGPRIKRHNAIITYIERGLRRQEYEVSNEPEIHTKAGLRKPDLIAKRGITAILIDAQVVNDQTDLNSAHKQKSELYKDLMETIKEKWNVQEVKFTSATLSWRGVWSGGSAEELTSLGIIRKRSLKVLSSRRYADNQDVKRIVVEEEEDLVETQSITVCKNIMSLYTSVNMIGKKKKKNSQMPRHLISDAHEWINEIPTRRRFLILRCRLFLSLRSRIRQASDCSPANRERELGLDRRETDDLGTWRGVVLGRAVTTLRSQHEARGLCHSAGRQLRELESNTRLGTLPLRRPTAQRARESNTRLGTLPLRRPTAQRSSRKQHEARGLCHSAGRQLRELGEATRGSGDFRGHPSADRPGEPPRKQHEARGSCHPGRRGYLIDSSFLTRGETPRGVEISPPAPIYRRALDPFGHQRYGVCITELAKHCSAYKSVVRTRTLLRELASRPLRELVSLRFGRLADIRSAALYTVSLRPFISRILPFVWSGTVPGCKQHDIRDLDAGG